MSMSRLTSPVAPRVGAGARFSTHGHVGDDAPALHHLEDAAADDRRAGRCVDAAGRRSGSAAGDLAVLGLEQARRSPSARRLARAVGAEQGDDLALRHREATAAQHQDDVVVDDLDVVDLERRSGAPGPGGRPDPKPTTGGGWGADTRGFPYCFMGKRDYSPAPTHLSSQCPAQGLPDLRLSNPATRRLRSTSRRNRLEPHGAVRHQLGVVALLVSPATRARIRPTVRRRGGPCPSR